MKNYHPELLCELALVTGIMCGCAHPSITAVNLNEKKAPEGIPFYLPKAYLVISKNVRYIPSQPIGLTQPVSIPSSFDTAKGNAGGEASTSKTNGTTAGGGKQPSGGKAKNGANTNGVALTAKEMGGDASNVPPGAGIPSSNAPSVGLQSIAVVPSGPISDGLIPQEFYTYNFVFLPDLTQKYGLRISGGVGELRASENLVNGWMHTGPGPLYMKDSNSAETLTATGQMVSSIGSTLGQIALSAAGIPTLPKLPSNVSLTAKELGQGLQTINNYAQIYIYEQMLTTDCHGKSMVKWVAVTNMNFGRDWIGLEQRGAGGTQGVAQGSTSQDNQAMDEAIAKQLTADGWTNVKVETALETETSSVTINVKATQARKSASDLKTDCTRAATQFIKTQNLVISDDKITIHPQIQ